MAKDSDSKPTGPDEETKRKFREALERKNKGGGVDMSENGDHGKVDHAHGPEAHQKMFRRKSGG